MSEPRNAGSGHSPLVVLARAAITAYVAERRVLEVPSEPDPVLLARAAAFVSLKKSGALRGCIGSIEPVHPTLAHEIIQNAIAAATRDPRFPPVQPSEINGLSISVDVLSPLQPVSGLAQFDPCRYGMVLRAGERRGLLLPDLEGVGTPEEQFAIVCRKAGINEGEPMQFYRFTVTRHC